MKEFRELEDFIGTHFIYTYDNSWEHEWYARNDHTVDYRIHGGVIKGRWVKGREVGIVKLTDGVFKITWTELTRIDVVLDFMPNEKKLHGVIFFPKQVEEHPETTATFQSKHIAEMEAAREKYETYLKLLVPEFATITYMGDVGIDNEGVISKEPYDGMPGGIRSEEHFDESYKRVK